MKEKIPEFRFEGFTDTWEQRKLGGLVDIKLGFSGDASLTSGEFKLTKIETISDGVINFKKTGFYNERPDEKYKLNKGDILFSNINSLAHIGKVAIYDSSEELFHGINLLRLVPKNIFVFPGFIFYQLISEPSRNWARAHANQAVNQASINQTTLSNQDLVVSSLDEQQSIGSFFSTLDHLITLQQRELDYLKETKKTMLSELFPKKSETIPGVRFDGFTDAWEQRRLGSITESFSGGTPTVGKAEYYNGEIPFIRSGEISLETTELFVTEAGVINSSAKLVEVGDILYALYGATSGEVSISKIHGAINQAILALRPTQNDNPYLIVQWLNKQKPVIISTYLQGGQGNLSSSIVKNLIITLPLNKEEQDKLGSFFSALDHLITLQQRKLDLLKSQKQTLLKSMFPR